MNLDEWRTQTHTNLRTLAQTLRQMTPGVLYGALSTAVLAPFVAAASQGQAPYGELFALLGSVGGNLISNQLQAWKDRSEAELADELTANAARDADWRAALNALQEKFETQRVVQAILSEADFDRFERMLHAAVTGLERGLVIDARIGDHTEMVAIAETVTQTKSEQHYHYYGAADKTPALRNRYLRRLVRTCGNLPLALLGGDEESGSTVTLDDVYIDLNTQSYEEIPSDEQKQPASQRRLNDRDEKRQLSALVVATRHPRLVLLGDPGSGKSVFVQRMAGWIAAAALGEKEPPPEWPAKLLPIFTVLRDLAPKLANLELAGLREDERDKRLLGAVFEHWHTELGNNNCDAFYEAFQEALAEGAVLLVFDGLDEVPQQTRTLVR